MRMEGEKSEIEYDSQLLDTKNDEGHSDPS
jgi:hypothetical protein